MKKIYKNIILFIALLISGNLFATKHTITVQDWQFDPATLTVTVGDTITWSWLSGFHTTTSTSVPSGASTWSGSLNSGSLTFEYVVAVAGTYNYQCNFHGANHGMVAQFTAMTSGINTPDAVSNFNLSAVSPSVYNVAYSLQHSSDVAILIYDLTGKSVRRFAAAMQPAGDYQTTYYLEDLQKGIYLFEMVINNQRLAKRIIIE